MKGLLKPGTKTARKRILIVDDDAEFLSEIEETLALSGYDVRATTQAVDAVECAVQMNPDLILLDLRMEGMTGFEVANKLRRIPQTQKIPILVMSGYFTEDKDGSLLSFFNMENYLQKPFNPLDVIFQVERLLRERDEEEF